MMVVPTVVLDHAMIPCFVEFEADNEERFERLKGVFSALKHDQDSDDFRPDEQWPELFDREALDCFNWWTDAERDRWLPGIPDFELSHKAGRPRLEWDFFSMIDAFKNGDYQLVDCRQTGEAKARLEFNPWGHPYGGTECMIALVRCFGFTVTGEDDGRGFKTLKVR